MNKFELAKKFHETYERLAPSFGYKTREASAVSWENVPKNNKDLMIAVCAEILNYIEFQYKIDNSDYGDFIDPLVEKLKDRMILRDFTHGR